MSNAGTYRLSSGAFFYIGSSTNLRRRKADHSWRLTRGAHHNPEIQKAFDETREAAFIPIDFMKQGRDETRIEFSRRLRAAEQKLLDHYAGDPGLVNKSTSAFGPDNGALMKEKWQDPEFRTKMLGFLTAAAGRPKSPETREKMAKAKRGAKNVKARPVIVTCPKGKKTRFDCVSDAAKFFDVTQQLMDQWMKGVTAWPGTGRITRERNRWIIGYSAAFA